MMNKKGFFPLLIRTALTLLVITFLVFYFLSGNDSSEAKASTKAVIRTIAETAGEFADLDKNNSAPSNNSGNSTKPLNIHLEEEKTKAISP